MMRREIGTYLVIDSEICHGAPTVAGTRIRVLDVLELLELGLTWDELVYQFHNSFSREAVRECIQFSTEVFKLHAENVPEEFPLPIPA